MARTAAIVAPARTRVGRRFFVGLGVLGALVAAPLLYPRIDQLTAPTPTSQPTATTTPDRSQDEIVSDSPIPVATTDGLPVNVVATETTTSAPPDPQLDEDIARLEIDEVFDPVHDKLASVVGVPIRLPLGLGEAAKSWTPTLSSVDAGGYVVHLGSGDDCNGASQCRVSTFTARRSLRNEPTVTTTGTPVPLPNGLEGVFSDSSCGSDCNNGFITWVEENVLYSVGSRLASGPAVLSLAWGAIDSTQAAPQPPEICGPGAPSDLGRVARSLTTELADGRSMHWLVVCSIDGTMVEVLDEPGELRWFDIDDDGFRDALVRGQAGSTSIFAVGANTPRAAIDIATSGRLTVGDLGCADLDENGSKEAIDRASGDELVFINPTTVRRSPLLDIDMSSVGDC